MSNPTPPTNPNSTEQEQRELEGVAMNIVFQICDTVVPDGIEGIKIRQANNDRMIDFTMALIAASQRQAIQRFAEELLKKLPQDLETKENDSAEIIRYVHGHNAGLYQVRQRIEAALREANHA